jgi:hypothetical protein
VEPRVAATAAATRSDTSRSDASTSCNV